MTIVMVKVTTHPAQLLTCCSLLQSNCVSVPHILTSCLSRALLPSFSSSHTSFFFLLFSSSLFCLFPCREKACSCSHSAHSFHSWFPGSMILKTSFVSAFVKECSEEDSSIDKRHSLSPVSLAALSRLDGFLKVLRSPAEAKSACLFNPVVPS